MMLSLQSGISRLQGLLRRFRVEPGLNRALRALCCLLGGFCLSAASLGACPQPLALGLLFACHRWWGALAALGGAGGYLLFWGKAGLQGILWLTLGIPLAAGLQLLPRTRITPAFAPTAACLITAATGLYFQLWLGDLTPVPMYLLRIALAGGSAWAFSAAREQDSAARWLVCGAGVLALAQIAPVPWLSLGYVAAGALCCGGGFPGAALAGLALDLAQVTPIPMTAVTCLTYFWQRLPWGKKWLPGVYPVLVCTGIMGLCSAWDPMPLPGLLLGGILGLFLPGQPQTAHRLSPTGLAQVRLELSAGVFQQLQQTLLDLPAPPIDEPALLERATERCCGGCPERKACGSRESVARLPAQLLHRPLLDGADLPVPCAREGRLLRELRRAQEQLRAIRSDRQRQKEYRAALTQQYRFTADYLRELSDALGRREPVTVSKFRPEIAIAANRPAEDNGDRCVRFQGTGCKYYVLLCDGMGTGLEAAEEGRAATALLRQLLTAGYPAEHALRTLNSFCALRGAAGAVTADLAELSLDTGKVALYKWGAPASWLLRPGMAEQLGTTGPPPGLSVEDSRESVERLSLRRGETLVLVSDGVGAAETSRVWLTWQTTSAAELAALILETATGTDDATAAVIRLKEL